jgi:hypothetical protein
VIRCSRSVSILALAVASVACSPSVRWNATSTSDFRPSGHTVSVFGVYKDGQMSSDAWSALRPRLEPVLGGHRCEIAHGDRPTDDPLLTAVDDYTRTNGPTDDLLAQLAPAAGGDLILVLVVAGRLPAPDEKVSVVNSPSPKGPSPMGSKGSAGFSTFARDKRGGAGDSDVLQLSASLFSVAQGRSVAMIDLQYSGQSTDAAEREFTAGLARLLPAATCRGWDWHTHVDAERIRKLAEE